LRRILNYGHTIGHAIEDHFEYAIPHGRCVAWGMKAVGRLAVAIGAWSERDAARQDALIDAFGLAPGALDFDVEAVMRLMRGDKKATRDSVVFVMPTRIGQVEIRDDIDPEAVRAALESIRKS
jgi:3-dehydroquinate synthase